MPSDTDPPICHPPSFFSGPKTHSRLIINDVMIADSGNYTCSAPNTQSSSIDVFVSPGTGQVFLLVQWEKATP